MGLVSPTPGERDFWEANCPPEQEDIKDLNTDTLAQKDKVQSEISEFNCSFYLIITVVPKEIVDIAVPVIRFFVRRHIDL